MDVRRFIAENIVYLDGGLGTQLQAAGLAPGEYPETWNISHPEIVRSIHEAYFDAGSNIVCANTFGANGLKFPPSELAAIIRAAVDNARAAQTGSGGNQEKFVALDIGPSGKLLKPYGDLAFEDAVSLFGQIVRLGVEAGVDLVFIETMNDGYETKAALLAAKENSDLPVLVANAYGGDGKLFTGASPEVMAAMLEAMGADAIGANCSLGPRQLREVIRRLLACSSRPIILKPNAGLPTSVQGRAVYDVGPEEFALDLAAEIQAGVRLAGGCCGTTPDHIRRLKEQTQGLRPLPISKKSVPCVTSAVQRVVFGQEPVLIGERINPTGKKRFQQALKENDMAYILQEGVGQQEAGAHILDVNVGLPEIDEALTLKSVVAELQSVVSLPLQIDTANSQALEAALRCYNGKALINSITGKEESMRAVFPLVKKYGGLVVALTLDEQGIPSTARGRADIARRILARAAEYGLGKEDLIFDPLALTISADRQAALTTLEAVDMISKELGCLTSLGVSNVSFGLPQRDAVNSAFFLAALERGLSAAIINPFSPETQKAWRAYQALHGNDENCAAYIRWAERSTSTEQAAVSPSSGDVANLSLSKAILQGLKAQATEMTHALLATLAPLDIVGREIIPALDQVGRAFEEKTLYLPQLLISAEAAKSAFEVIRAQATQSREASLSRCPFVLATVQGDIHDIGKNIVRLLLENYGFQVSDLGKDVAPEKVVAEVRRLHAPLAGLSALMTTTVPAMAETIRQLRREAPWCRVVVGGAVLTADYARSIGADKYARDAMDTVRYGEEIDSAHS